MHVEVRKVKNVVVVDLEGRLMAGIGDEILHNVMNELVAEGWKRVLLNLSQVSRIDSSGLGELVSGVKMAERLGTHVKLINVHGKVLEILELGQVTPLLDIFDDEAGALASFEAEDAAPGATSGLAS